MALDRTVAPPFQPIQDIRFVNPRKITLSNGLQAWLIQAGEQEVIRLEWISASGRWFENETGTSFFALKMLGEGAGDLSSEAFSEAFQQYGAFLELNNGFDFSTIAVYCLTRHLDPILGLLHTMITSPAYKEEELANLKNIKIQEIRLNQQKNNIRASQAFRNCIFGDDHPYGKELDEAQTQSISIEQIKDYFSSTLLQDTDLIISGNFGDKEIQKIDNVLGDIQCNPNRTQTKFKISGTKKKIIEIDGSLQSSIRMGKKFLNINDPDYIPMLFVNEILGGYFGSRLMKNIREDKGFTYGIYSSMIALRQEGYFVIGTDVKKEHSEATISEIHKEIEIIRNHPVPADELETVKNYMLGSLISSMDTAFDRADKFKSVHLKGHTMEYYENLVRSIKEMNSSSILRLAQKHLDKDSFTLVTVG